MPDRAATLEILRDGVIDVVGRVIGSSNNALFVTVACPDPGPLEPLAAIYKPTAGERPLDDFPDGTLDEAGGRRVARLGVERLGHRPPDRAA